MAASFKATGKRSPWKIENNGGADGLQRDYSVTAPELDGAVDAPQVRTAASDL